MNPEDIEDVLERIKKIKRIENDKDLAQLFGVSASNFSNRKQRGSLLPLIVDWAINERFSVDWLLTGAGERRMRQNIDDDLDVPTFIRNGNGRNHYDQVGKPKKTAIELIRENPEWSLCEEDDDAPPTAPRCQVVAQEKTAVIVQLLARILAAGKPKLVDMVALYLQNIMVLIEDDKGPPKK